jgi:hypothetical protein
MLTFCHRVENGGWYVGGQKSRKIIYVICERPLRQRVSNSTDNVQVKNRYNKNALKLGRLRRMIEGAPVRLLSYLRTLA